MNILETITQIIPGFAMLGTYLLILAHSRKHLPERVKKNGVETVGTVIEIRHNSTPSTSQHETLVVDFTYASGSYRHVSNEYISPSEYKVGEKVKIWYHFYKSQREVVIEDEGVGNLPAKLYRWGIISCLISYPFLIIRMMNLM